MALLSNSALQIDSSTSYRLNERYDWPLSDIICGPSQIFQALCEDGLMQEYQNPRKLLPVF